MHSDLPFVNVVLSSLLLVWPSSHSCVCPPCATTDSVLIAQLQAALEFAQTTANDCRNSCRISLFWLGFLCGLLFGVACWILGGVLRRLLQRALVTEASARTPKVSPKALTGPAPDQQIIEPHNPNSLRPLGLLQ